MFTCERQASGVLLERCETVLTKVLARQPPELRPNPHVVLRVGLVHRLERPGNPSDAGLDGREAKLRKALEHARGAEIRERFHGRSERVHRVVDDGPAVTARRTWITSSRNVEGDRQVGLLDGLPEWIELRKIVVRMPGVVPAPHGLAWKREPAEAQLRDAPNLHDGPLEIAGRHRRHRREPVVVRAEGFPGPVVPDPAHGVREDRVGGRPHREALVREDDLRIDAVARIVAQPLLWGPAGSISLEVFPFVDHVLKPHRAESFGELEERAVAARVDSRKPIPVLDVDPLRPQARGLVRVAVGRDHQELAGVPRAGAARPALGPWRRRPPLVGRIDLHPRTPPWSTHPQTARTSTRGPRPPVRPRTPRRIGHPRLAPWRRAPGSRRPGGSGS